MTPRSSIEKLPEDVRRWLEQALTENGFSGYVELEQLLKEKGYSISKSVIHRYGQQIENRLKAIKESVELAKLITEQVDDEGDSQSDALMRLVQTDLMNLLIEAHNVESLSVKDRLKALGMIGKNIASMTTASVKLKEYQAEHKAKLLAKLDEMASNAEQDGSDFPTLERVRKGLLEPMGLAANTLAKTVLLDYQKKWLADDSRFKVAMFARQTGKTFTTTLEIVLDCLAVEAKGERTRWVILSRGERQAKEANNEGVKRHMEAMGVACNVLEVPFNATLNALEVVFPNGSKITALPTNPDTARGFSANVFLDEFAFHADSREIWKALFPVISAGWKLRVVSTPNGKGNKFYELMMDLANTEWSRHTVDIYQAVADGLPRNVEQLKKGLNDEDAWAQEFELHWLDEASSWLSYDLIDSVEHHQAGIPELYSGNPCFVGMDIVVRGDLTVIWVLELLLDKGNYYA